MIKRLVLLPGMHGTGELFSDFMRMMSEPKQIEAPYYPTDASPSYDQLQAMVEFFFPTSEDFVLLAESYSTPLAIQYAATNPPNLKGLILCAGFATSPIRGWRKSIASLIAPLAFRLPLPKIAVSRFLVGPDAPESLHTAVHAAIRSVKPKVLAARLYQVLAVDAQPALVKGHSTDSLHSSPTRPLGWANLPRRDSTNQAADRSRRRRWTPPDPSAKTTAMRGCCRDIPQQPAVDLTTED